MLKRAKLQLSKRDLKAPANSILATCPVTGMVHTISFPSAAILAQTEGLVFDYHSPISSLSGARLLLEKLEYKPALLAQLEPTLLAGLVLSIYSHFSLLPKIEEVGDRLVANKLLASASGGLISMLLASRSLTAANAVHVPKLDISWHSFSLHGVQGLGDALQAYAAAVSQALYELSFASPVAYIEHVSRIEKGETRRAKKYESQRASIARTITKEIKESLTPSIIQFLLEDGQDKLVELLKGKFQNPYYFINAINETLDKLETKLGSLVDRYSKGDTSDIVTRSTIELLAEIRSRIEETPRNTENQDDILYSVASSSPDLVEYQQRKHLSIRERLAKIAAKKAAKKAGGTQ